MVFLQSPDYAEQENSVSLTVSCSDDLVYGLAYSYYFCLACPSFGSMMFHWRFPRKRQGKSKVVKFKLTSHVVHFCTFGYIRNWGILEGRTVFINSFWCCPRLGWILRLEPLQRVFFWQAWELTSEDEGPQVDPACLSREKSRSCLSYIELFRWWTASRYCAWRWHLKVLVLCVCAHTGAWKAIAGRSPFVACPGLPGF